MRKLLVFVVALVVFGPAAAADIIVFKTETEKEGIIEEETPTRVKIRIKDAVLGISRDNVLKIEYGTPEENRELELKWRAEKEKRAEESRKKREEAERLEKELETKGLVKEGGEWVSPAEAEKMREEEIRRQIREEQAAREAEETVAPEVPELPDFVRDLTESEKEQYIAAIETIEVSQIRTRPQSRTVTILTCEVRNRGEESARKVLLDIEVYDRAGEVVYAQSASVVNVSPDESKWLQVSMRVGDEFIDRVEVRVVDVE
ncbi:MAG: hypothetical protein JSV16_14890 [Candidatus Hydrogenedentota bacterium]|nr:MAG: hypothetical protein JSV16_14890 [Candidatus Hydrogenedentota bacterium]